ncbi:MAG: Glu/Leu/Phe/Val dehydrogenase dimerization domain-containing protein [Minisyncoccia bacterium]|jgi:leucine dehydrogenase
MDEISGIKITPPSQTIKNGHFGLQYKDLLFQKNGFHVLDSELLSKFSEFDDHNLAANVTDSKTGLDAYISIHRGGYFNPAFGATRLWHYEDGREALEDSLRLSRLMSFKSALADLKYGGAKGVIVCPAVKNGFDAKRPQILKKYAEKINCLNGRFVTGTDVGLQQEDVRIMSEYSPYFVGNKVNPTEYTAKGLLLGINECLKKAFGKGDISGRSFAVQGVGKIGTALIKALYPFAKTIYAADIYPEKIKTLKASYPKVKMVSPSLIHQQKVDVFSPCAIGLILNNNSIKKIRSPIIAGGANNQLADLDIGRKIHEIGIIYAPDYVINAGGLISVADEYENDNMDSQRINKRLNCIKDNMKNILETSERQNKPTNIVADEMARSIFNQFK